MTEHAEASNEQGSVGNLQQESSDANSTSTNSLNAKVVRIGNRLLPRANHVIISENVPQDLEKLKSQRMRFSDNSSFWILTHSEFDEKLQVPRWARIFYLAQNVGLKAPEVLWHSVYGLNMLHLDTQLGIVIVGLSYILGFLIFCWQHIF